MSQTETIQTPQDYVNYTFNIEARGIAEVSSELMGLSNTVGNILGQIAFKTSEFLSHTDMLAIGVGAAISSMFVSATKDAITFQQQVANVQAIGGEAINAGAIGDAAMEYSNKFGMATASMTEGLEALARAGITSTNVMKEVLAEGVKLSKLEGMDLEDSINDLISTTNLLSENGVDMNDANYGKLVQEMNQHIVSTSESAPINAQNIIQSLQHVGGYASASGMDQDDLFAVIAQLGARGTKGEMAGTALRAFIAAGQKDTAQRALSRVGLNVSDLWNDNGETMLSISEMKNVLDEALEARGYSKQEKLEFYSDFVGYKQANQIMKIDTSEVQKYKESIANAWDLGKKLETILGTVRGNLDRIWQITQNFMTKVGSKLLTVAGIILEPIRVMLEIFTSLPFADTAVAAGMIFIAFRTGLTIFNKLVPSMVGFVSGISDVSKESVNLRNIWRDTNSELQQAKEIFNMIKNQDREGLVNTAFDEHELIGRHKDELEDMIAGQHYMNSPLFKKYKRLPWDDLPKPMQYLIKLQLKGNEDFNKNYQTALEKAKEDAKLVSQTPLDLSSLEDDKKSQLEAINVWVKNIFDLLKTELTKGTDDDKPVNNRNRNAQADILSSIFNNKIDRHVYGNYEFKYRTDDGGYDYQRLKNDIVKLQDNIRDKVSAFENKNKNNITSAQLNTYKKLFTGVSEGGQANSLRANESEVRLVLGTGQLEHHDNPWQGLKDEQVRIIARELGLSQYENYTSNNQGVSADVAIDLHDKLESGNFSNEEKQSIIDRIVEQTNKEWRKQVPIGPAVDPKKLLLENPQIANKIVSSLGIDASGFSDNTHAVHEYFKTERTDEELNKAAQIAFEVLKQNNDFSIPEQRELQYMMESLQRMKNTMEYLGNNALDLGFSDAIKDEMLQIVQDMNGHNDLFRAGAEELGEALVHGFVSEGLERRSPGRMYKEMYAELEAIKVLLSDFDISDYANNILSDFNPKQFAVDSKKYTYKPGSLQKDDIKAQNAIDWSFDDVVQPFSDYVFPYNTDLNNRARGYKKWYDKEHFDKWTNSRLSSDYTGKKIDAYRQFIDDTNAALNHAIYTKGIPLSKDTHLYRGGFLPDFNDNNIGFFNSITSTTYNKRIGDEYAEKHGGLLNIYTPNHVKSLLAGGNILRDNDFYLDEQERTFGYGQPLMQIGDIYDYKTENGEIVNATDLLALTPEHILGIKTAIESEVDDVNAILKEKIPGLQDSSFLLANKMTKSFIEDGLGRHSPGDWYNAVDDETEDVMDLINNRSDKIGSMIRSFLGENRESLVNQLNTADGLITGLGDKKVRIQGSDGKNKFQSYDVLIDNLITDALFSLENEWKGDRFTALDYLKGKAPEGADLKDALTNEEIVNFYKSLSSEDILNEVQRLTMQDAQQSQHINEQIEALLRIKEEIRENFEQQKSTYKQLDINDVELGADEVVEGVSFPSFNIGSDPEAKRIYDKTWGEVLFNYSGNDMLRDKPDANSPDALLSDVEGIGIPSFLDGKTLLEATTILNNAIVNGSAGLPINVINVRSGHLNTDEKTGIGYLTGTTSTAYTDAMADGYYTGSKLKIYAPMGTKGFNFDDRNEFTLPANTAYIELSKTVDEYGEVFAEILLLTEEQMKAMGLSRTINGAYRVESDKTPFEQLFNPENVDTNYHINNTPANWLEYIDINTQAITNQGKADAEFMNFLNSTLPTIVENSLHNGFIEMKEVGEIIRSLIPDVHYYQQMMTLVQYAVQNLESDGGIFMEPAVWDNIKEAVFTSASYESYAREEEERQQQEQEELINARTASDINDSINYTEDIEKNSAMFGDMNGYYDYIANNKYGRARRLLQNSSFFSDDAEYKKKRIFGFDEDGNSVQKGTEYVTDKNGNLVSNKRFRPRKWMQDAMIGAVDWAERTEYRVKDAIDRRYIASQEQAKKIGADNGLSKTREDFANILQPVQDFSGVLSDLSEIFPFLTPAVAGLNTALTIAGYAITTLEVMEGILAVARGEATFAAMAESESTMAATAGKILLTAATWAESESDVVATVGKGILAGATLVTAGAEALLTVVREIGLLPLLAIIAAIAALIAIVYLSEKNHAEALKENQKALEDNNKSMNAALANYKSLHQARLSAVNVGRQRIAALKESVALYKLETARSERLNNIRKKSQLENDPLWGETGSLRADLQTGHGLGAVLNMLPLGNLAKILSGEYEPVADKHSENIYQTMSIIDEAQQSDVFTDLITRHNSSFGNDVQLYQKQHTEQFAQMDAFAPQLQELYEVETQAQRIYGEEGARDSDMFKRALQDVANETGLSGETLGAYLDYMQVEANVENARMMATSGFNEIQAQIQSDVMQQLYGDNNQMGDLDSLQDTMVKAMVEDEARKAKRELFEQGMMQYMQAIYSFLGGRWDEGWKHVDAGNAYLQGMQTIDENKQRILEESKEIAEENLRKDYGTGAYSIYGDTPFGGAVESAKSIGLSVPTSSSSQSHNSSITSSNTTKNINKATSDAQTAANTSKKLIDQQKTNGQSNANAETSEKSGEGLGLGDIAKSAVSGALDFAKKYSPLVGVISAFFPDKEHSEVQPTVNKYEIKVEQININTEDDPEKIKSALMNLIIEMQEQITPRQVSRTIGELPQQVFNDAANMAQGVDSTIRNVVKDADNALNNAIKGLNNQK